MPEPPAIKPEDGPEAGLPAVPAKPARQDPNALKSPLDVRADEEVLIQARRFRDVGSSPEDLRALYYATYVGAMERGSFGPAVNALNAIRELDAQDAPPSKPEEVPDSEKPLSKDELAISLRDALRGVVNGDSRAPIIDLEAEPSGEEGG